MNFVARRYWLLPLACVLTSILLLNNFARAGSLVALRLRLDATRVNFRSEANLSRTGFVDRGTEVEIRVDSSLIPAGEISQRDLVRIIDRTDARWVALRRNNRTRHFPVQAVRIRRPSPNSSANISAESTGYLHLNTLAREGKIKIVSSANDDLVAFTGASPTTAAYAEEAAALERIPVRSVAPRGPEELPVPSARDVPGPLAVADVPGVNVPPLAPAPTLIAAPAEPGPQLSPLPQIAEVPSVRAPTIVTALPPRPITIAEPGSPPAPPAPANASGSSNFLVRQQDNPPPPPAPTLFTAPAAPAEMPGAAVADSVPLPRMPWLRPDAAVAERRDPKREIAAGSSPASASGATEASAPPAAMPPVGTSAFISPTLVSSQGASPAPLPTSLPILIIGDSHINGSLGANLHRGLASSGYPTASYGLGGSVPSHWLSGADSGRDRLLSSGFYKRRPYSSGRVNNEEFRVPPQRPLLDGLIDRHRPAVFVVEFGDNMANYRGQLNENSVRLQVSQLLQRLEQAPNFSADRCFFASPTYGEERTVAGMNYGKTHEKLAKLIEVLRNAVGDRCQFIDSRNLPGVSPQTIRTTDSLHLDGPSGALVAKGIREVILARLAENPRRGIEPAGAASVHAEGTRGTQVRAN